LVSGGAAEEAQATTAPERVAPTSVDDDVDPWDEPADTVSPAQVAAPESEPEPSPPSDHMVTEGAAEEAEGTPAPADVDPAPAPTASTDDVNPWDEPTDTGTPASVSAPGKTSGTSPSAGDPALLDDRDPWD
jgi:hypothetical protein